VAEVLQVVAFWLPFGASLAAIFMGVVLSFMATLVWPRYLMLLFLGIFILSPNEGAWAMKDPSLAFNVYDKGRSYLFFPLLHFYLWGMWLGVQLRFAFSGERGHPSPLKWWIIAFAALVFCHALLAPAFDRNVLEALLPSGLVNIVSMGIAFTLMLQLFTTQKEAESLERWFLILFAGRMLWGAIRFVALGGDPMNVYDVRQNIPVRITFFDINDNLLACASLFLAAWRLAQTPRGREHVFRGFYVLVIALALFTLVLSFRRTVWMGLVLATVALLTSRQWPHRAITFAGVVGVGVPALLYAAYDRFAEVAQSRGSLLSGFFPDVTQRGMLSFESGRFSELTAMFRSIGDNWLWGLGAWGEFDGRFYADLHFHQGYYLYVHSGLGHVFLKAGVLGLLLFVALLVVYTSFALRHRSQVHARLRPLFETSLVVAAFSVPNLIGGTPIIELRTMVLLGVFLSLPFLAMGLQARDPPERP
jgi:hypothetical protein